MDWQAAASLERERKLEKIREKTRKGNRRKKRKNQSRNETTNERNLGKDSIFLIQKSTR